MILRVKNLILEWKGSTNVSERCSAFLGWVLWAAYFLLLLIVLYSPGGITESDEFRIFVLGWGTVPFLAGMTIGVFEILRRKFFAQYGAAFYLMILAVNVLLWNVALAAIRISQTKSSGVSLWAALDQQIPSWQTGVFIKREVPPELLWAVVAGIPLVNAVCLITLKIFTSLRKIDYTSRTLANILWMFSILGGGALSCHFSGIRFTEFPGILLALVLALAACFHRRIVTCIPPQRIRVAGGVFLGLMAVFLIVDPGFSFDRHHQNHWLGPVLDLINGKSLLVDSECQYGVLNIYFVKSLFSFMPLSYQGFNLWVSFLYIMLYGACYALLRHTLQSTVWTWIVWVVMILTNSLATIGEAAAYPSIGPLRFGLPYLLLLMVVWRQKNPERSTTGFFGESIVMAVASVWSFETLIYTVCAYAALTAYESFLAGTSAKEGISTLSKRWGMTLAGSVVAHVLLALDIHARSGQWPHWERYLGYIFLYSSEGFGTMPVAPFSPWVVYVFLPLASLWAIAYLSFVSRRDDPSLREFAIIIAVSGLAIGQFTYFLGRSHPNNLFHISVPVIWLAAFWLAYAAKHCDHLPGKVYLAVTYGGYAAGILLLVQIAPSVIEKFQNRIDGYVNIKENVRRVWVPQPSNRKVAEAMALIDRYVPNRSRILLFIDAEDTTETLMLTRKAHVFPFNHALQASVLKEARRRVLDFNPPVKEGDVLIASREYSDLQAMVVQNLKKRFNLIARDVSPSGIVVFDLQNIRSLPREKG